MLVCQIPIFICQIPAAWCTLLVCQISIALCIVLVCQIPIATCIVLVFRAPEPPVPLSQWWLLLLYQAPAAKRNRLLCGREWSEKRVWCQHLYERYRGLLLPNCPPSRFPISELSHKEIKPLYSVKSWSRFLYNVKYVSCYCDVFIFHAKTKRENYYNMIQSCF